MFSSLIPSNVGIQSQEERALAEEDGQRAASGAAEIRAAWPQDGHCWPHADAGPPRPEERLPGNQGI